MKYLPFLLIGFVGTLQAQKGSFEGVKIINGTQLYLKVFGKGDPLIVVHGGPGLNHTYLLPHLESLSKDYRVILYDERASGRSAIPSTDSLRLKYFAEDINAIRIALGYEKINLLGHSWGVIPAIQYGLNHPETVKTLILCNPAPLSTEFEAAIGKAAKLRRTKSDSTERANILQSQDFKDGKASARRELMLISFRHSFYNPDNLAKLRMELPDNVVQANRALFGGLSKDTGYNYYDSVGRFTFPLLVLHGEADTFPKEASDKIREKLPSAQVVVFNKSGHFIFIEEPDKFRKTLTDFTKRK